MFICGGGDFNSDDRIFLFFFLFSVFIYTHLSHNVFFLGCLERFYKSSIDMYTSLLLYIIAIIFLIVG